MKKIAISLDIGLPLVKSIILLLLVLLPLEVIFQTTLIPDQISELEFYGSSHQYFDRQVKNARSREKNTGKIDCIFVGNSQTLYGIKPKIIEQVYLQNTGTEITCQNFGLGGLTPIGQKTIVEMLINEFNPDIIIIGTNMLDYASSKQSQADRNILSSPWLNYMLGVFSIDGWLIENSVFYRHFLGFDYYLLEGNSPELEIQENGYSTKFSEHIEVDLDAQIDFFKKKTSSPDILKVHRTALRNTLDFQEENNITFILLEMPFDPFVFSIEPKATKVHPEFELFLQSTAERYSVDLWLMQSTIEIPKNNWYDFVHLNQQGSTYFSKVIGENLSHIDFIGD